ncbi:L-threonylcarbamoyladenylate synthase [Halalkalibacter sp. APA_J-10(15)]|uniref:L-threonylcarbamoyladenylate synthase n=1 Tax=Halalkalibacter sp. APA_J-10(15) TaxID=2933805 RepID=UPI001FF4E957|nr:L-threonylcarbamoyladenylate synthase [Halalkalibacter sp. APA_J-10(15)]MCK0470032.1 L-threonylcarbamoyladenylate synthase [Halalkalibacter sp. APA_J-10(15)]
MVDKDDQFLHKSSEIKEAALWIKNGDVIAFPTETVYGLGANALDEEAIQNIFQAKGRPSDNPLIVHIAKEEQLKELVIDVPLVAKKLIHAFWPGPLTIILKRTNSIAESVTAGLDTVGVRMPSHPIALTLIEAADVPIAAPSANQSGKPSPTSASHVIHDLNGKIAGVVDGGVTGVGVESTVVDCSVDRVILYRPGGVTKEEIEAVIGPIEVDPSLQAETEAPRSPGMKYTHYAPIGQLYVVSDCGKINNYVQEARAKGHRVGVLTTEERKAKYDADIVVACGKRDDLSTVAQKLYDSLRTFDQQKAEIIYAEAFPKEGIGIAIMNRLEKAADAVI